MKDSNGQYIPWSLFDAPLKITTDGSSLKKRQIAEFLRNHAA
jgi:hypothetical protein